MNPVRTILILNSFRHRLRFLAPLSCRQESMWAAVDEGDVAHLRTLLHRHRLAPVFVDRAGRTPLYRAVVEKARARDSFSTHSV
jgi:hypothetical protein